MGRLSFKAAQALDTAAGVLDSVGNRIGGEKGRGIAEAVVNRTLAPIRRHIDEDCTGCQNGTCDRR
jgi:hypothetical protein